jgi:hypothetical protein
MNLFRLRRQSRRDGWAKMRLRGKSASGLGREPQISPLRAFSAPVEMTNLRLASGLKP